MKRCRRFLFLAVLVGLAMAGLVTPLWADFTVKIYDDNVLQSIAVIPLGGNSLVYGGTTTHFSITNGSALSNNPGTQDGSNLDLSNMSQIATTFGASGGTHTLRIELTQTDFATPVGSPLTLSSSAGGSFGLISGSTMGSSVTSTYQGFLDNTNAAFGKPVAGSTTLQTAIASLSAAGTAPLVFDPGTSVNPNVPGGTPFSITDVLTFTFTVAPGSGQLSANVSASTVAVVPAPSGFAFALIGLPCLGIAHIWRWKRKSV